MSPQFLSLPAAFRRMGEAGELARFYGALGLSYSAGLPMTTTLASLCNPDAEETARRRAVPLREAIAAGGTLADGARAGGFLDLEVALIELGETSGRLQVTLAALAEFFEADQRLALEIKSRVFKLMINPIAGAFILPLPILYKFGLKPYLLMSVPMLAATLAGGGMLAWWSFTSTRGAPRYAIARFLWALALGLEAGLPIVRSIHLAAAALGPSTTATRLFSVPTSEWSRSELAVTLARTCELPRNAIMMVENMERTGNTASTLKWMAKAFEEGTLS